MSSGTTRSKPSSSTPATATRARTPRSTISSPNTGSDPSWRPTPTATSTTRWASPEPQSNSLFTGDTLFRESIGRTDLPGGDYSWIMRSILDILLPLGDEVHVYPGHGPESTIGHEVLYNPFIVEVLNEEVNYKD